MSFAPGHMTKIRKYIAEKFSMNEIKVLCFNIGINDENIPGNTLDTKSAELVKYCIRHDKMEELISECKAQRPNTMWNDLRDVTDSCQYQTEKVNEYGKTTGTELKRVERGVILQETNDLDVARRTFERAVYYIEIDNIVSDSSLRFIYEAVCNLLEILCAPKQTKETDQTKEAKEYFRQTFDLLSNLDPTISEKYIRRLKVQFRNLDNNT